MNRKSSTTRSRSAVNTRYPWPSPPTHPSREVRPRTVEISVRGRCVWMGHTILSGFDSHFTLDCF